MKETISNGPVAEEPYSKEKIQQARRELSAAEWDLHKAETSRDVMREGLTLLERIVNFSSNREYARAARAQKLKVEQLRKNVEDLLAQAEQEAT